MRAFDAYKILDEQEAGSLIDLKRKKVQRAMSFDEQQKSPGMD